MTAVIDRPLHSDSECETETRNRMRSWGCGWIGSPVVYPTMKAVALTAHFDGEKVQFDEPCQLETNARLVVVVLPPEDERHAWSRFSAGQLAKAYGENEPEYSAADLRS